MAYSLITAAVATGAHRTTILRAIKSGKISAERDAQGAWVIQPSELHRVFAPLPQLPAVAEPVQTHHPEAEIALLRTMLEEMRATVADLRRRGVEFTDEIRDVGYGLATHFRLPGDFTVQLYQPRYTKGTARQ